MPNPETSGIAVAGLGTTQSATAMIPPAGARTNGGEGGDSGDEVTRTDVNAARLVLREHRRVCVPEPACNGCLKTWPCADVVWAWHLLPDEE
jgi:hypothetical protein